MAKIRDKMTALDEHVTENISRLTCFDGIDTFKNHPTIKSTIYDSYIVTFLGIKRLNNWW